VNLPPAGGPGDFVRNPRASAGARLGKLHEIHGVMESMREPVQAPDLTDAILSRVEAERPFTDAGERRWIWAGRASVAAGILMLLGAVFVLHTLAPRSTTWANRPAPLSAVIDSAENEVGAGYLTIRAQLASVGNIVPSVEVAAPDDKASGCSSGGCWAAPVLTFSTSAAGLGEGGGIGSPFVRFKAEFLRDQHLAAQAQQTRPVEPQTPH
jgi:hypothetical protein